jgi:hypothetical protein
MLEALLRFNLLSWTGVGHRGWPGILLLRCRKSFSQTNSPGEALKSVVQLIVQYCSGDVLILTLMCRVRSPLRICINLWPGVKRQQIGGT